MAVSSLPASGARYAAVGLALLTASACAPLPQREARPSQSSLGCMRAAIEHRLPHGPNDQGLPDDQTHCIAAGLIARYCSVTEATLASAGKELKDLLGSGDAEWRDLQSDRRGIDCARIAGTDQAVVDCCLQTPPPAKR